MYTELAGGGTLLSQEERDVGQTTALGFHSKLPPFAMHTAIVDKFNGRFSGSLEDSPFESFGGDTPAGSRPPR